MNVELAPHNKQGLALRSPLIAGSGAVGLGDAWPPGVGPHHFGAFVLPPISLSPRRGRPQPRLAELPAGFVLSTGSQNPGYRRALQEHWRDWQRLGIPLLAALDEPEDGDGGGGVASADWARLAEHWGDSGLVAGLELILPEDAGPRGAREAVAAVRRATTLPLWARLPVVQAAALAEACVNGGADALVVGTAPAAAYPAADGTLVEGVIGGPAALPFALRALRQVAAMRLGVPLIAAGGIQSVGDARLCLELGAAAIQVRSLLWTNPAAVVRLSEMLAAEGHDQVG